MFEETEETAEPSTGAKTGIFWDLDDFQIPECLDPFEVRENIESALKKKGFLVDWAVFFLYAEKTKLRWPESKVCHYEDAGYVVLTDGEDKHSKAGWMLLDIHLWFLDNAVPNPDAEYNMMIVSNHITEEPEFISVLKTLITKCHKVLLVQPEKSKCHKGLLVQTENLAQPMEAESFGTEKLVESFCTESADWLWLTHASSGTSMIAQSLRILILIRFTGISNQLLRMRVIVVMWNSRFMVGTKSWRMGICWMLELLSYPKSLNM